MITFSLFVCLAMTLQSPLFQGTHFRIDFTFLDEEVETAAARSFWTGAHYYKFFVCLSLPKQNFVPFLPFNDYEDRKNTVELIILNPGNKIHIEKKIHIGSATKKVSIFIDFIFFPFVYCGILEFTVFCEKVFNSRNILRGCK